jgi:curli biogenesis system outer membrane secretion channel CsgG
MKIIALTVALLASGTASAQMAPMPADGTGAMPVQTAYPRCSATVQDQCIQSNARESDTKGGPPANMQMMRHHRMMTHHRHMMKHHTMKM